MSNVTLFIYRIVLGISTKANVIHLTAMVIKDKDDLLERSMK